MLSGKIIRLEAECEGRRHVASKAVHIAKGSLEICSMDLFIVVEPI